MGCSFPAVMSSPTRALHAAPSTPCPPPSPVPSASPSGPPWVATGQGSGRRLRCQGQREALGSSPRTHCSPVLGHTPPKGCRGSGEVTPQGLGR